MSFPPPVNSKIGKLISLLGSDKDGEVLGAARAIKRTLESAGADLHALAVRLSGDRPQPGPRYNYRPPTYGPPPAPRPTRWRNLTSGEKVLALDGIRGLPLSPWERQFVRSIDDRLRANPCAALSTRQVAILDTLLHKAWEASDGCP